MEDFERRLEEWRREDLQDRRREALWNAMVDIDRRAGRADRGHQGDVSMETKEEKLARWAREEARNRERTRKRRAIVQLVIGIASMIVSLLTLAVAIIAFTRA